MKAKQPLLHSSGFLVLHVLAVQLQSWASLTSRGGCRVISGTGFLLLFLFAVPHHLKAGSQVMKAERLKGICCVVKKKDLTAAGIWVGIPACHSPARILNGTVPLLACLYHIAVQLSYNRSGFCSFFRADPGETATTASIHSPASQQVWCGAQISFLQHGDVPL